MAEPIDLLSAVEACRPGSDDLESPEMEPVRAAVASDATVAQQFEAIQRFDAKLGDVMRQGDVPRGLEDRVLQALAAASGESVETPAPGVRPARRIGRRRVWTVVAIAATVAAIATGAALWRFLVDEHQLARTDIEEQAAGWCDALAETDWRRDAVPQQTYPFATEVLASPDAWQPVSLPGAAGEAVAYRIAPPAGVRRMTLLVLKARVSGVPQLPPPHPYKTQDRLVAAWQFGGNVVVLVIQGDDLALLEETYDRYVRTSFPPV